MPFKGFSYLELFSAERFHLCNCGRGYQEVQFCEIIFEFGSVVQEEMSFKRFLI